MYNIYIYTIINTILHIHVCIYKLFGSAYFEYLNIPEGHRTRRPVVLSMAMSRMLWVPLHSRNFSTSMSTSHHVLLENNRVSYDLCLGFEDITYITS